MTFKRTTACNKLLPLSKRVKVVQGSSSAGKTYGILSILIDRATKTPNLEISVVSETIPHLRRGAMKDFLKVMDWTKRYVDVRWNKTLLTYTFANGSYIEFFSADQETKIRGARRNILYINEANNINFETYHQLAIRTNKEVWIDYNPSSEFWAHNELMNEGDTDFIILTYKDNEALDTSIVKEIEKAREKASTSSYWANWWKVYGLGELGSLQGTIYNNWEQMSEVPKEAQLKGIGVDFGYTNDPTAIIAVYKLNGLFILDELAYKTEMSNKDIIDLVKPYKTLVVCDSAEPKSIAELRLSGISAMPCSKGADSVVNGIQRIQALDKFYVTQQSINTIKELRGYRWITDKNNVQINEPIGVNNHAMDSKRYILTFLLNNSGMGVRFGSA